MFCDATSFNQPIGNWKFPKVIKMNCMFYGAKSFNQDISNWEFPEVKDMSSMFYGATSVNQDFSKWDLREKETEGIFNGCPIKKTYKPKIK
jgi:surface protein